jgi:hypothetical protein
MGSIILEEFFEAADLATELARILGYSNSRDRAFERVGAQS